VIILAAGKLILKPKYAIATYFILNKFLDKKNAAVVFIFFDQKHSTEKQNCHARPGIFFIRR
jgi:hypothetical protein